METVGIKSINKTVNFDLYKLFLKKSGKQLHQLLSSQL